MKVSIPTPLRSYTGERAVVEASGATVAALLEDLDRHHPGLRFRVLDEQDRIRPHVRIFVNRVPVRRIDVALAEDDEVHVFQALSGG